MQRHNFPLFYRQAIKNKLAEWGIAPQAANRLLDTYNTLESANALFKLESYINGGYSTSEALYELHRDFPKLTLFKTSNELAGEALDRVSANSPNKELQHKFSALTHLAKTALYCVEPDAKWVDVRLAGRSPSLFILDNYSDIKSSIGSRTKEWTWLSKREFYKLKFKAAINELPPDIESKLPDCFTFYRALESCYQKDNFYIHESVLPTELKDHISEYYGETFTSAQ